MRYDTLNASAYLVWRINFSPRVKNILDDGDLVLVTLDTGEQIMIYLIERATSLSDIQYYYRTNTEKGIYTLMVFRADLLLPEHNDHYRLDAWMTPLLSLQNDRIYGFEVAGQKAWFFPAHFDGTGYRRRVRYGSIVNYTQFHCRRVTSDSPHLRGTWHVAGFGIPAYDRRRRYHQGEGDDNEIDATPLTVYFHMLNVADGTSLPDVKRAYRALARRYHPDVNNSAEAHIRMKQINDAYMRVVRYLREQN